ncbi:ScbR family autoregulator-binding transcription factor [Streptomyces malaysiense]|uniref:TetR family transcriptional regulator n=1 Tax=Streptomyces malaysiense TaxID=1428626 RepID=A0A1J4PS79_9ACTN|nr:ScbR family autoregulator-binding transcription factor [Streptomyces malaysiense]OIK23570.1 TetR family transcriptional regulator [Streptomyces malaysiense]
MKSKVRQERAVRTREAILQAAAEVFDEVGYSKASIRMIMERAQVTQGGMYFHFKSKQGIAEAVVASQQKFVQLPEGTDGLQRLVNITFHLAGELQTNARFRASVRLAVEQEEFGGRDATAYLEWAEQFHRQLLAARARNELRFGVDELEFATLLMSAYTGVQIFSNISTGRADLVERVASLWRYLLPALAQEDVINRLRISPPDSLPAAEKA